MRPTTLAALAALLLSAPIALTSQEAPATEAAATEAAAPTTISAPAAAAAEGGYGLPQAAAPPRTLRAYWHVFIAFALAWGLLFAYALWLGRKFGALEAEVARLRSDRG